MDTFFDEIQIKDEEPEDESYADAVTAMNVSREDENKKCGDVLVGYHGNFTLVCALCTSIFEDLPSFGLHIHSLHLELGVTGQHPRQHNSESSQTIDEVLLDKVIKVESDNEADLPAEAVYDVQDVDAYTKIRTGANIHCNTSIDSSTSRDSIGVDCERSGLVNAQEFNDKAIAIASKMMSDSIDINSREGLSLSLINSDSIVFKAAKEIMCKYCFETFIGTESCDCHIEKEHPLKLYTCPHCPKSFKRKESRNYHLDGHEGKKPYECPYCPKAFTMPSNLKAHVNVHWNRRTKFACRLCDKKISENPNLNRNYIIQKMERCLLYSAPEDDVLAKDGSLRQDVHENILPSLKPEPPDGDENILERNSPKPTKAEACPSANDDVQSEDSQTTTSRQNCETFCCYSCGNIFMKIESYRKHYRNQHPGMIENDCSKSLCEHPLFVPKVPEEMLCKYCLNTFTDPEAYQNHMENAHLDKLYTCSHCSKSFSLKVDRNRHVDSHKGNKRYKCPHCPKAFTSGTNLKAHIVFVHMNIRSQFTCRFCDKKFQRNPDLKRHELIHTGEKNTPCSRCELMFRDNRQLRRHMRKKHMHEELGECK